MRKLDVLACLCLHTIHRIYECDKIPQKKKKKNARSDVTIVIVYVLYIFN